jgi:hypothetical protein
MKVETISFLSVWDLDGSDVIYDLDFGLTWGDGLTFHAASDVLHEVLREPSARTLVESLHKVIQKFGNNFYLAF